MSMPAGGAPIPTPGKWVDAQVLAIRDETARAKTFRLRLPQPSQHLAGQHYVVRLTAPDGYTASRSYSVASAIVCSTAPRSARATRCWTSGAVTA